MCYLRTTPELTTVDSQPGVNCRTLPPVLLAPAASCCLIHRRTIGATHLPANPRRKRLPLRITPVLPPPHAVVGIRTATIRVQGLQQEATPLGIARHD